MPTAIVTPAAEATKSPSGSSCRADIEDAPSVGFGETGADADAAGRSVAALGCVEGDGIGDELGSVTTSGVAVTVGVGPEAAGPRSAAGLGVTSGLMVTFGPPLGVAVALGVAVGIEVGFGVGVGLTVGLGVGGGGVAFAASTWIVPLEQPRKYVPSVAQPI